MHNRVNTPLRVALAGAAALALPTIAHAAPGPTNPSAPAAESSSTAESPPTTPWIQQWAPRNNMWEVGVYGGLWIPAGNIELHDRDLPHINYDLSAQLGLRVGYYPLRHFGFEAELAMIPTRLQTEQRAFVSTARAHAILQLGVGRIVPFVLVGGGVLSVRSEDNAAGLDRDQSLHIGGGVKLMLTENLLLRLDGRDVMSPQEGRSPAAPAHSGEVLLGFSLALGPRKKPQPILDHDGDGFLDAADSCPAQPGIAPDGCPAQDTDTDGFLDREDACPAQAGAAPDGCPIPDRDGDGYLDPDDACPEQVGVSPDGCPILDIDNDGLLAPQDQCPTDPENYNGFEDTDGCPEEIPEAIMQFTGVIEGIYFATGKAVIRKKSFLRLDSAVKVLAKYPALRVEIVGHTDSRGDYGRNMELSRARAASVKNYMVENGIHEKRITTRGAGPDEPIGNNTTKQGRRTNRRIEFKLITASPPTSDQVTKP